MPNSIEDSENLDITKYILADIIEWRADYLQKSDILDAASIIFKKFKDQKILFTIRTSREGGNITLSNEEYVDLIKVVNKIYSPDFIDFEYFSYKECYDELKGFSNLVLSYHNFNETPKNLKNIFKEMSDLSPYVVKVAVMPESNQDVLELMNVTRGFKNQYPEQKYSSMSMGKLGRISRIAGGLTGSSWAYASLGSSSAPGQVALDKFFNILEVLDED